MNKLRVVEVQHVIVVFNLVETKTKRYAAAYHFKSKMRGKEMKMNSSTGKGEIDSLLCF